MCHRGSFILPPVVLWICFLLAECTSKCTVKENVAFCILRNLHEVPALPPSITDLDLSLNYIGEIHEKSFAGLEALQFLKIQQQEVKLILRRNAFSGLSNLTKLDLAYNTELQVDPGAFDGLFDLQILVLTECKLHETILSGDYLRPLVSLEQLFLSGNNIRQIRPASFFTNMSKLHIVDISHNWIKSFCEEDLFHFRGKRFTLFRLRDIKMFDMNPFWESWSKCGNPFKNMSMKVLDLSLNSFSVDTAVLFFKAIRGTRIHRLVLNSSGSMGKGVGFNNMKDPDRNTFKDLFESGITALDLSKASIFSLKHSVFSSMPDLIEISLSDNVINQIEKDAFNGLENLKTLNLSNNLLDKISTGTFNHLGRLETLDLSNNNIRMLMRESFQGLNNLSHLSLSENSLKHVHTLAHLPRLETLFLDNNKITSLYGLPSRTRNVTTIDLRYNRLTDAESFYTILSEFPNIEKILLGGNMFSSCFRNANNPVSPLNNVRILDLHLTGLQALWVRGKCLDMFDHLHRLQTLDLQRNSIHSLPKDIFQGLTSLHTLDLSFNSITYISTQNTFPKSLRTLVLSHNHLGSVDPKAFSTLNVLELSGNRFLCDCSLRDFQMWLSRTDVKMLSLPEELRCAYPEQQRGKPLLRAALCKDKID